MSWLNQIDPTYLCAAGCAVAVWVVLRRAMRSNRPAPADSRRLDPTPGAHHRPDDPQQNPASLAERMQIDLYDLDRDVSARLDTKMRLLQQLMAQSQAQIDRLEHLLAQLETQQQPDSTDLASSSR